MDNIQQIIDAVQKGLLLIARASVQKSRSRLGRDAWAPAYIVVCFTFLPTNFLVENSYIFWKVMYFL